MKPETFTLLLWEEIPETTKFYLIPNSLVEKYLPTLRAVAGKHINAIGDDIPELQQMNIWIYGEDGMMGPDAELHAFQIEETSCVESPITCVIRSGFYL